MAVPGVRGAYELPDRAYPESIAVDPRTGDIYASSFRTGTVYRGRPGTTAAETFLPAGADGRTTANGVKVDANGRLWVIDHVRNVVYRVGAEQLADALAHGGQGGTLRDYADLGATKDPAARNPMTLNGIAADDAGEYLIVADMTDGDLYRVTTEPQPVVHRVTLTGGDALDADGLELHADTLWVVHNKGNAVSRWQLTADGTKAEPRHRVTDPALDIPTAIAHTGDRALITVSQFDKNGPYGTGTPAGFRIVEISQL
ncbi:hypothetical protein NS14008_07310 [Nocardia seriolae]|nr:hypothetical protein NS14008_07310 [Nocardia seriolae]